MKLGGWVARSARPLVLAYPATLAVVALSLHFGGEGHWATTIGLYLPAVFYLGPLLVVTPLAFLLGSKRWLLAPLAALWLGLFPLMGLSCSWGGARSSESPRFRLLSYNVNSVWAGSPAVLEQIAGHDPDVVLLQEFENHKEELLGLLRQRYPHVQESTQFAVASRFPIVSTTEPPRIPYGDRERSPRFLRHVLSTPLGLVVVYNVHPLSPRESLAAVRGAGLRRELSSGRLLRGENRQVVEDNTGLRVLQVERIGAMVRSEELPVIVAGDTNLPTPSPLRRRQLGQLQDGFASVGRGFGYTFPTKFPFLRLDRIMASDELEFLDFEVDCAEASDHQCVVAEFARAR